MKFRNVIVALAVSAAATLSPAYGQTTEGKSVGAAIGQIASGLAGRIGFAAQEIGGDEVIAFNGDETFAMASTYKVAVATKVMDLVDKGELSLDQMVDVPQDMYVAGVVAIAERFPYSGVQFSLANLIYPMITESDNTATDVLMGLAGGPAAVTENLRRLGITDFRVDRPVRGILMDFYGVPSVTPEAVVEAISNNPALVAAQLDPNPDFEADPRDHTTPNAYLKLLLAIDQWHGDEPGKPRVPAGRHVAHAHRRWSYQGAVAEGNACRAQDRNLRRSCQRRRLCHAPRRSAVCYRRVHEQQQDLHGGQGSGNCRDRPHAVRPLLPGSGGEEIGG